MKKIFVIMLFVILLSGCGAKNGAKEDKNLFTSIKDAISKSITLKCDYVDEEGNKAIVYLKGKVVRMESEAVIGEGQTQKIYSLIKDNKFYIWGYTSNTGLVFDMSKQAANENKSMGDTKIKSSDDMINELEAKKENCKHEVVSDSFFEVPSDINFTSNLFEGFMGQ